MVNVMIICIAGMHRSGTSMVARLLNLCGLYLGQDKDLMPAQPDNPEGFWEHLGFVDINQRILAQLGGTWDRPPAPAKGWESQPETVPLCQRAEDLVKEFSRANPWGWKDPRNSLTLPFWNRVLPNLKVLICVRNPLEVMHSLRKRNNFSEAFGLELWQVYHQRLLAACPRGQRVVTHYDAYFADPHMELRRVLSMFGVVVPKDSLDRACASAKPELRHNSVSAGDFLKARLPAAVLRTYAELCAES